MSARRIASALVAFLILAVSAVHQSGLVPPPGDRWLALVAALLGIAGTTLLPAVFGEAPVPLVESAVQVAKRVGPVLVALALSGCATAPVRYAPPDPVACSRAVAAAALRVAALPVCAPPVDERACTLAALAAAVGAVECFPVAVR